MKYLKKTSPPETFSAWCQQQQALGVNYNYCSLQNPQKRALHEKLVVEQGFICPYTMKRISRVASHLEHIVPQHLCTNGLDLDYFNLLACYPAGNQRTKCPFGAQNKGRWWANNGNDFVSPLNESCELKFYFNLKGEIFPANKKSSQAITTIKVLNLDEDSLANDRKRSIEEFIFGQETDSQNVLSPQEADHAINIIWKPNQEGILHEFCMAIHDALYEYLDIFPKLLQNQDQQ